MTTKDSDRQSSGARNEDRPRRKRRRWVRRLIVAAIVLAAGVWAMPHAASTGVGTGAIESLLNARLAGTFEVEDLSIGWLGPTVVRGLRVRDPAGRQVLSVREATWAGGTWKAIWSREDFSRATASGVEAVLYETAGGGFSLADAFQPTERPERVEPMEVGSPRGKAVISDVSVRVVRLDGRALDGRIERAEFDVDTLDRIDGEFLIACTGGRLRGLAKIRNLAPGGKLDPAAAAGSVKLTMEAPISLGEVARFAAGRRDVDGSASVAASVSFGAGQVRAELKQLKLKALRSVGGMGVEPIDLAMSGHVALAAGRLEVKLALSGPGRIDVYLDVPTAGEDRWPPARQLLSAAMAGGEVSLPKLTLRIDGELELGAVLRAVPGLLNVRADTTVTSGRLAMRDVRVTGGSAPAASGVVELTGLAVRRGGREIRFKPVTAKFDLVGGGEGVRIRQAKLTAPFAAISAEGTPKKLDGTFSADLSELRRQLGEVIDLGRFDLAGKVSGRFALRGAAAERVGFSAKVSLDGRPLATVERAHYGFDTGALAATVKVPGADLAKLGRIAEGLLPAWRSRYGGRGRCELTVARASRDGPIITSGSAAIEGLTADGAALGAARASWKRLAWSPGDRAIRADALDFAGRDTELAARDVRASFGPNPSVAGKVKLKADLAWCQTAFERIAERHEFFELKGRLAAEGSVSTQAGKMSFSGVATLTSPARRTLAFSAAGWARPADGAFHVAANLTRADLKHLGELAVEMGYHALKDYSGTVRLAATIDRAGGSAAIVSSGSGTVSGLGVRNVPVGEKDVALSWSSAQRAGAERAFRIGRAEVSAGFAAATIEDLRCRYDETFELSGQVRASGRLGPCLAAIAPVVGWKKTPALAGAWQWDGRFRTRGEQVALTGAGAISDFQIGIGRGAIRESGVRAIHDVVIDRRSETVTLRRAELRSELLSLTLGGTISRYRTERTLDLSGEYSGSWERIVALVHQLAPATAGKLSLKGPLKGRFTATGPANRPELRPAFGKLKAQAGIGWDSANLYGLKLGAAALAPRLADGRIVLPQTIIREGSGGLVRPGFAIDFPAGRAVLKIPGKVKVLENVFVRRDAGLGADLLGRFNPLLLRSEGRGTLTLEDLSIPLDERIRQAGAGKGRLDLKDMKVKPTGVLGELLTLGGLTSLTGDVFQVVKTDGLDFRIRKGRIEYENFTMTFAETFDPRFSGSVGFDDTVDLTVSIPLRPALLKRFGAGLGKGVVGDLFRVLDGMRVPIHIGGTRTNARLDFSKLRIDKIIQEGLRRLALERLLRPPRRKDAPKDRRPRGPASGPAEKDPTQELIDSIFDLLR